MRHEMRRRLEGAPAHIESRGGGADGMEELRSPLGWTFLGDEDPWRVADVGVFHPVPWERFRVS